MSDPNNFSEQTEINIEFCFNPSSSIKQQWRNINKNAIQKKRVFEVFHKKEMICSEPDSISNKVGEKHPLFYYKCIYCGNKYNNMNRFEAHMRIHVSK